MCCAQLRFLSAQLRKAFVDGSKPASKVHKFMLQNWGRLYYLCIECLKPMGSKFEAKTNFQRAIDKLKAGSCSWRISYWRIVHRYTIYSVFGGGQGFKLPASGDVNNYSGTSPTRCHMLSTNSRCSFCQQSRGATALFCTLTIGMSPLSPLLIHTRSLQFMNWGSENGRHTWMESACHSESRGGNANPATPLSHVHPLHGQAPGVIVPPQQDPAHQS